MVVVIGRGEHVVGVLGPGILHSGIRIQIHDLDMTVFPRIVVVGVQVIDSQYDRRDFGIHEPYEIVRFAAGHGPALGSGRTQISADVGNIFVDAIIPKDHVWGIQVVLLRLENDDGFAGEAPVDSVRGRKQVQGGSGERRGVSDVSQLAKSLFGNCVGVQKHSGANESIFDASGTVAKNDVVLLASEDLSQTQHGLFPVNPVLGACIGQTLKPPFIPHRFAGVGIPLFGSPGAVPEVINIPLP